MNGLAKFEEYILMKGVGGRRISEFHPLIQLNEYHPDIDAWVYR